MVRKVGPRLRDDASWPRGRGEFTQLRAHLFHHPCRWTHWLTISTHVMIQTNTRGHLGLCPLVCVEKNYPWIPNLRCLDIDHSVSMSVFSEVVVWKSRVPPPHCDHEFDSHLRSQVRQLQNRVNPYSQWYVEFGGVGRGRTLVVRCGDCYQSAILLIWTIRTVIDLIAPTLVKSF